MGQASNAQYLTNKKTTNNMNTIIDLAKMDVEQLCEMFNDKDGILEKAGIDPNDIIREFINRGGATVNIQRAAGSLCGRKMQIWYNRSRNCIEVSGYHFFEGTDLLQW